MRMSRHTSVHQSFSPTSMFLRNLMLTDTEEMIRAQPINAVVLIAGEWGPFRHGICSP